MRIALSTFSACLAFAIAPMAGADVLAQFGFGDDPAETFDATELNGVTATTISGNAGLTVISDGDTGLSINNSGGAAASYSVLQVAYLASGTAYVEFSITPVGDPLDLENFVIDAASNGGSGPRGFSVQYSFDGFATAGIVAGGVPELTPATGENFYSRSTFALADQDALNNLTAGTTTFRIYGTVPADGNTLRFDNITVNGTVVPEPASIGLLGLGSALILGRRRRA